MHPAALAEAEAAIEWYRGRSVTAADGFLDELTRTLDLISKHPSLFQHYLLGTQRALLRRYPYLVVFREAATEFEVIAVAHGRRRPGYWQDRLQ